MRILLTNDDGIHAEGLAVLARCAASLGQVKIVAPDAERSACSHSMTLRDPLRVREHKWPDAQVQAFTVNGLPVDCVNVGREVAWPDGPDLVISGVNNGPNLGFDVTYSGTVGGAMEGAINGIPAIAVSMARFVDDAPLHYDTGERWLTENLAMLAELAQEKLMLVNVNIPAIAYPEINGHKFVGMGRRVYEDRLERREDPWGRTYYWQGGVVVVSKDEVDTDVAAVAEGYVAITPVSLDWTDHGLVAKWKQAQVRNSERILSS